MLNRQLTKFAHYQRLRKHMEINENLWKENLDIKLTFNRMKAPFTSRMRTKLESNKKKLGMFLAMLLICKMEFAYKMLLGTIPYRQQAFNYVKAKILGLHSVYPGGVVEQIFENKLDAELIECVLQLDDRLPFGFTRKLLLRALKESGVKLSKEEKQRFYAASGHFYGVCGKLSGLHLQELNKILISIPQADIQEKLKKVLPNILPQEMAWQKMHLHREFVFKDTSPLSQERRIQPKFEQI